MAALLLGLPTAGEYDQNVFIATQSDYLSLYVQDDWKLSKNLTLNLGLRFDHDFPLYERHNRAVNGFDTSVETPLTAAATAAYNSNPISQVPVGQFKPVWRPHLSRQLEPAALKTPSKTLSPRIGLRRVQMPSKTKPHCSTSVQSTPVDLVQQRLT
jgi:outer membrane receptor protein involved in Fe transport